MTTLPNARTTWNLITGEYPPEHGGVADYTQQVASRLADESCEVHVWCRGDETSGVHVKPGLTIHRTAGGFGIAGLRRMGSGLDSLDGRRILLVQYVPHGFGFRAMNLFFCFWLLVRQWRGDEVRVMFHEVAFPFVRRPLKWNILAVVQRIMAVIVLFAAGKVYTSTAAWNPILCRLSVGRRQAEVVPIPSNLPTAASDRGIAKARCLQGPEAGAIVGHFGTYAPNMTSILTPILERTLSLSSSSRIVLLGRGSYEYFKRFTVERPQIATRITAFDDLSPEDASAHIEACDIMVQPFIDGASSRRTSLMACLAMGTPTITTIGASSEPYWQSQELCAAVPVGDVDGFAEILKSWLAEPSLRVASGEQSKRFYVEHFSLDHTIDALLGRKSIARSPVEDDVAVDG